MIRTFETRLDLRADELRPLNSVLDQYAEVMNHAQRLIHAKLKSGREWKGDLHTSLYKELGIGSAHLNMAYRQLLAKLGSIKELAKDRISDLKGKIKSKEGDIAKHNKAIGKNKADTKKALSDLRLWEERCAPFKAAADAGQINAAIDRFGNPVRTWTIPLNTYGLSTGEAKDLIRKVAKEFAMEAKRLGVPVVSEKLDFARKKRDLKAQDGAKYARMLSSLAYSSFDAALASACARNRVAHRRVNPAYTSLIGRVKFARRYGLSVHTAAAVSIARRAMELFEGIPRNVDGSVTVPLNNSEHVTLAPPVRKKLRHVWSEWSEVNKELKKAHEEQRLSGQPKRSRPYTRHWRECGGTGHLRHGLSGLIGRAVNVQLSRNGQGLAKRQEAIPELQIRQECRNVVST